MSFEEIEKNKKFNKSICLENIRYLLKENTDVKIGQIEKESGVSLGYMSRLEKPENTTEPSIEFIVTASKLLRIGVDVLLFTDLTALSTNELYLSKILQKLYEETLKDSLLWNKDSAEKLNQLEVKHNGFVEHPLFNFESFYEKSETEYPELVERVVFSSNSFDYHTAINDDCFSLNMKRGAILYLMDVCKSVHRVNDSDAFAKEIWIYKPGLGAEFLVSNRTSKLSDLVNLLFDTVKKSSQHPKINPEIKSVLDAFYNNDDLGENDDYDALPF